jgi:hypothetical protein
LVGKNPKQTLVIPMNKHFVPFWWLINVWQVDKIRPLIKVDPSGKHEFLYAKTFIFHQWRRSLSQKGKKIYNHGQIVVCLTLKFQATPHFLRPRFVFLFLHGVLPFSLLGLFL